MALGVEHMAYDLCRGLSCRLPDADHRQVPVDLALQEWLYAQYVIEALGLLAAC